MKHITFLTGILLAGCGLSPEFSPCRDVDCSGHGSCLTLAADDSSEQVPTCACDDGYLPSESGLLCLPATDSSLCAGITCSGNGTCVSLAGAPRCVCDTGFTLDPDGTDCLDPCGGITCADHGTCSVVDATARCRCDEGYTPSADGLDCLAAGDYLTYTLVANAYPSESLGRVTLDLSKIDQGEISERVEFRIHGMTRGESRQVWTLDGSGEEVTAVEIEQMVGHCRVRRQRWIKATFDGQGVGALSFQRGSQLVNASLSYQGSKRPIPMLGGFEYPGWTFGVLSPAFFIQALARFDKSVAGPQTLEVFLPTAGSVGPVTVEASGTPDKPVLDFLEHGITVSFDGTIPEQITLHQSDVTLARAAVTPADLNLDPMAPGTPFAPAPLPTTPLEVDISFASTDGTLLRGTIALPNTGSYGLPAVLMVGDAVAADRDHPFALLTRAPLYHDLAAHLAHAGFASLRYDPRGRGASQGDRATVTLAQLVADAKVAHEALATSPEIDPGRIFILSHGTSSAVALTAIKEGLAVKGYVALAPAIRQLDQVLLYRVTQPFLAAKCWNVYLSQVESYFKASLEGIADGSYTEDELSFVPVSLWKDWLAFDGSATLGSFTGPALVLRGDQDMEIPAEQVTAAEDAATAAGKINLTAETLPGLTFTFAEGSMEQLWESAALPLDLPQTATDPLITWLADNQ